MELELIRHHGVVLDVGEDSSFDAKGAAFACAVIVRSEKIYLIYSGGNDTEFHTSTIGLAISQDGIHFRKIGDVLADRSGTFCADSAMTPAVFERGDQYMMILAGSSASKPSRRIGMAIADDFIGPWRIQGELLSPRSVWEGYDIDCGAGVCKNDGLFYYSSVWEERVLPARRGLIALDRLLKAIGRKLRRDRSRYIAARKIGIARLIPAAAGTFIAQRYEANPLEHLNGPVGSWNESLFCPSYLNVAGYHYLFAAASTYSVGSPFRQYIGWIEGDSPYFAKATKLAPLIDGPAEKRAIIPSIKSEIALDSPSPVIRHDELYLYYSVMDRADNVWKTALSTFKTRQRRA